MNFKTIGDYNFNLKLLGKGSFSEVYKGFHNDTFQSVAIKKITKCINDKYVHSEIELMQALNHPYILKLYEVIRDTHDIFMILEYCGSGNLKTYIESKQMQYNNLYIYQIICGLKYLFHKNIIHRDIKPENILIHKHVIKICDFGFAKEIKDNDVLNTFCGSPLYMAPEILGFNKYTDKADIWSLGVIIYEIVFKQHPYPCKNKFQLINKIKSTEEISIPLVNCSGDSCPPCLQNMLEKCLHKNYHERIGWVQLFETEWYTSFASQEVNRRLSGASSMFPKSRGAPHARSCSSLSLNFEDVFEEDYDNSQDSIILSQENPSFTHDAHKACEEPKNTSSQIQYSVKLSSTRSPHYIPSSRSVACSKDVVYSCYEDSKVYSNSAPTHLQNDYLESVSENAQRSVQNCGYTILGKSPKIDKSQSFMNYLGKSVKTIKNIFKL